MASRRTGCLYGAAPQFGRGRPVAAAGLIP